MVNTFFKPIATNRLQSRPRLLKRARIRAKLRFERLARTKSFDETFIQSYSVLQCLEISISVSYMDALSLQRI